MSPYCFPQWLHQFIFPPSLPSSPFSPHPCHSAEFLIMSYLLDHAKHFFSIPWGLHDLSSSTKLLTRAPAVKAPRPNHWTTREFPIFFYFKSACITPTSREDVIYLFLIYYIFVLFHQVSHFWFLGFESSLVFGGRFCEILFCVCVPWTLSLQNHL